MRYNLGYCLAGSAAMEYDWNGTFYAGFNAFKNGTGQEANSLFGSPQIVSVNVSIPDFHIISTSPAIDAGDPGIGTDSSETDIDGDPRPMGNGFDIGADEFGTPVGNESVEEAGHLKLYPNPGQDLVYLDYGGKSLPGLSYRMWNLRGQLVDEGDASSGILRLDAFPPDLYFMQFIQDGKVIGTKKLMLD